MTDRISTLTVVLSADMRDDDAVDLANMLERIRGISSVKLGPVVNVMETVMRERLREQVANDVRHYIIHGKAPERD